jgi:hypothetical protein
MKNTIFQKKIINRYKVQLSLLMIITVNNNLICEYYQQHDVSVTILSQNKINKINFVITLSN